MGSDDQLQKSSSSFSKQPKATALRWCLDADHSASSSTAICISVGVTKEAEPPPAKKMKACSGGPEGTVRIRHILFRHQQLKQPGMMARREGIAKSSLEAEEAALKALELLIQAPTNFLKLCRELSDCQSGDQPGQLAGDLGWLGMGQNEASLEEAMFSLGVNEYSDIVTSTRGVHILQRLA